MLNLRALKLEDSELIHQSFVAQGWKKPAAKYRTYFTEQEAGIRDFILATWQNEFAGYLTVQWQSNYPPFQEQAIPEVVDFNVLKKFQRRKFGTALMDEAEKRIAQRSSLAGIGVGLTPDYGPAHILYIKRGYIPDGLGLYQNNQFLNYEDQVIMNDDLVLHFTKEL